MEDRMPRFLKLGPRTRIKAAASQAQQLQAAVAARCTEHGLQLRVSRMETTRRRGRTLSYHWMFDDACTGRRVMNYWPGNGTCMAQGMAKGKAADPWHALELACKARTGERPSSSLFAEGVARSVPSGV
jgi:hypothetical protein